MSTAKEIFDMSLNLGMLETLLIPAHNKNHQESLRVSLSYNRRTFLAKTDIDYDIIISKTTKGETHYVGLQKVPRISTGLVLSPNGSVRKMDLSPKKDPSFILNDPDTQEERIKAAMREDGYTEEEITEFLSSKTSNNDTLLECLETLDDEDKDV